MFEIVYDDDDADGRRLDGYTISSPCEPNGSGELIIETRKSALRGTHTHTHTHTLRALTLNVCVCRVYRADLYTRSRA